MIHILGGRWLGDDTLTDTPEPVLIRHSPRPRRIPFHEPGIAVMVVSDHIWSFGKLVAEDTGGTHLLLREVREAGDPFGRSDRSDAASRNDDHGKNPRIQPRIQENE